MAPKTGKKSNKTSGKALGAKKDSKARVSKPSSSKSSGVKRPPPQEQKSKPATAANGKGKAKRRHYTEKELGIPQLNMITPIGVAKPKGKKKGKVFVDDPRSMMTIMAMVNAEKEGQIESKMLRARQLEEIHQLKRQEQEERKAARREKLEDTKNSLRKKRLRKGRDVGGLGAGTTEADGASSGSAARAGGKKKKKVSFG